MKVKSINSYTESLRFIMDYAIEKADKDESVLIKEVVKDLNLLRSDLMKQKWNQVKNNTKYTTNEKRTTRKSKK